MNKEVKYSYRGMNQDLSKSKIPHDFYFEGKNIRIVATNSQSTASVTNEKGNSLILTIPIPVINSGNSTIDYLDKALPYTTNEIEDQYFVGSSYLLSGDQIIIGHTNVRNNIILFTTDNNGFDCIWKLNDTTFDITLLYMRDLDFSENFPIQVINNFENEKIDKVYWVDGNNQLRFININHSIANQDLEELIDLAINSINMVGSFDLSQPIVIDILQGGTHTSGMIQYAYNLYRINSSQTKLSPFSDLVSLDKDVLGGGELNEVVSSIPVVRIPDIDLDYTHIKVYAIKYTSFNQIPTISLIDEREIPNTGAIEVYDDGSIIETLSLEEFTFLGSDLIIPKHINSKDNRLFLANYKEINFDVDLDLRAYSFNSSNLAVVYDNLFLATPTTVSGTPFVINGTNYDDPGLDKFDSVNLDYPQYKYQFDGTTLGGEGKYIKYELTQDTEKTNKSRFFKDDELYRLGIQFYNKYGNISLPKWIADFRAPSGNLKGLYNTLRVELTTDFYIWLNTNVFDNDYNIPSGYRILVAERTFNDKTIVANGILSPMMVNDKSGTKNDDFDYKAGVAKASPKLPNFFMRNVGDNADILPIREAEHMQRLDISKFQDTEVFSNGGSSSSGSFYQFNSMLQMYSPEILFGEQFGITNSLKLKIKGGLHNTRNCSWNKEVNLEEGFNEVEGKVTNGISPFYASGTATSGNIYDMFDTGLVGHPGGSNANKMSKSQFYRVYGDNTNPTTDPNQQLITFTIPFTPDFSPNIVFADTNKNAKIILNPDNNDATFDLSYTADVIYTITPDPGYTAVNYSAYLKDSQTGGSYVTLSNVNNVQVINHTYTHLVTTSDVDNTYTLNYYLAIKPDNNFVGTIDIHIEYHEDETIFPFTQTLLNITDSSLNPFSLVPIVVGANPGYIVDPVTPVIEDIYGTPELIERGADFVTYNNDQNYRYVNSLQSILVDGELKYAEDGECGRRIVTMNSYGQRCITFVTGPDDPLVEHEDRPTLETMFTATGITGDHYGVIGELVKSDVEVYLGNIYGGNSYEDKRRSNYLEIGQYKEISNSIIDIKSPGDTFVNNFRFQRITALDTGFDNQCAQQMVEIVEFTTETTVDLKNRDDFSLLDWDSKFQPSNADYHKYNRVYSQQSNLLTRRDVNFNFKKVNFFDTNVISTKFKSAGELIDSWTDIQPNELITLDGKYGAINSLHSFKDELYTFQDSGIAFLSINPRIQVQGNDGVSIELGKGTVLNDYKYFTTESGTINKWSIVNSLAAIYFYDTLNKSLNIVSKDIQGLSDIKGLHTKFQKNNTTILRVNNPIIKQGVVSSFDYINNDMFMTFHQGEDSFTVTYNEGTNSFVSFYDYIPSRYISKGDNFITTDPTNTMIYKQYDGNFNEFYGVKYSSYITILANPEVDRDTVFDNIMYKSEIYLDDIDQSDKTLSSVRLYNEYQDSGVVPLILGRDTNLRRKFRDWNAILPREENTRQRIRNPWVYLKLQLDNPNNYKMILHDIVISYTI